MRNACRKCVSSDPSPPPLKTLVGPSHILIIYSILPLLPSWGKTLSISKARKLPRVQLGGVRTGVGSSQEFAVNSRVYNELRTTSKHMEKAGARLKGTRAGQRACGLDWM
jgi:hypothetical protein